MKRLLPYMKGNERECVLGPLFKLLEALLELLVPLVVASIIDRGIGGQDRKHIVMMCLLMAGMGFVGLVFSVTAQYFSAKAAVSFVTRLRSALFDHVQKLSFSQLDRQGTANIINRMTGDVNQLQNGINLTLRLLLRSPFVVFGAMIMAFTIDARSALTFAVIIPLLSAVVFGIMLTTIPMYKKTQGILDSALTTVRENLTGVRVVRAFCLEENEKRQFGSDTGRLFDMQNRVGRLSALLNPLTYVMINLAAAVLVYTGALRVDAGIITQGAVIALYNYMSQILVELIKLANLIITITRAVASGNRVAELLGTPAGTEILSIDGSERHDKENSGKAPVPFIEFRGVALDYHPESEESEPALSGISFSVNKGETVGIIGGTGSGKSSLVGLIPRFYDATEGEVLIEGRDVRTMDPEQLRRRVGYVPQKAALFSGTLRDNLLWGDSGASDEEIMEAAETAQIRDVIESRSEGLDYVVEQNGRNFSGGQRQRITIARALVGKPEILILDDSSSALDPATDAALRRALRKTQGDATVFIVSQRAASIAHADRIIVMEDGRAAAAGTHRELLETCGIYREIYESQYGEGAAAR